MCLGYWVGTLVVNKPNKKRNPIAKQLTHWYQRIKKSKKLYNRKVNRNLVQESSQDNG